jgi:uncharacterized membrane protein YhaH (DUF805 family)
LFSWKIGPWMYLAITFVMVVILAGINTYFAYNPNLRHASGIPSLYRGITIFLPLLYLTAVVPARLRDATLSPKLALLMLIPIVNFILWLYLFGCTKESVAKRRSAKRQKSEQDSWNI